MVDREILAAKLAAVRDSVARIEDTLPTTIELFRADRTAREVVAFNLFVALQECLALASHCLADEGWSVPRTYGEVFTALAEHSVIDSQLADRLRAAAGLRNLIAHRYAAIDFDRIYGLASTQAADLVTFCEQVARWAGKGVA